MEIGEILRSARENKGMVQEEVADLAGISQQHYSDLEKGELDPKWSLLQKVTKILGIIVEINPTQQVNCENYSKNDGQEYKVYQISGSRKELRRLRQENADLRNNAKLRDELDMRKDEEISELREKLGLE